MKVYLIWSDESDIEVSDIDVATANEQSIEVDMEEIQYDMFVSAHDLHMSTQSMLHYLIMASRKGEKYEVLS